MTEPMSVLHLTGKDPSTGEIKTFDFEIVDEVARRQKADKADTVQETTLSRGRKEGTEVGEGSVAFGTDVEASGEGSHAEGNGTIANAPYMYVFGEYNTPAEILPEWVTGTEYAAGDKVIYDGKAYVCDTANSDAEFDPANWTEIEMPEAPVFVIGNGTSENSRGDAFAVERDGDVKAGGDLYTNYDPATGTGKKVATEDYVGDMIGDVVSMEYAVAEELPATGEVGTIYLIPNGETSGTDTHDEYIWVPATESFEKIGNTKVDLSDYALKTDTVLNTTLSMGRKENTTVGQKSTALGKDVTASGYVSHAEGSSTTASGEQSHAEGAGTRASGAGAHAEGNNTWAFSSSAHAEGDSTQATGGQSHAEGGGSQATGASSHAEGHYTIASGGASHAEGNTTQATGGQSHAEGIESQATGQHSHAEGYGTIANGNTMHAQGKYNKPDDAIWPYWEVRKSYAVGDKVSYLGNGYTCNTANSDAEFNRNKWTKEIRNGDVAFVIGNGTADDKRFNAFVVKWDGTVQEGGTTASGQSSHAEGGGTTASGPQSHAEGGNGATASGNQSHAEGAGTQATGDQSHAEGSGSRATSTQSHAEGGGTLASGPQAHAEGGGSQATGASSHAEGGGTHATGASSHAEGGGTTASGIQSHAEGGGSQATGMAAHAEGNGTKATGDSSHAEGGSTTASGAQSHAEGAATTASASQSHAEGGGTTASGPQSHAEGSNTIANGVNMHAQGKYNKPDDTIWPDWEASKSYIVGDKVTYSGNGYTCKTANSDAKFTSRNWTMETSNGDVAFVIGNGTTDSARSNALTVNWDGTQKIAGDLYTNYDFDTNTGNKVATEAYVTEAIAGAGGGGGGSSDEYALKTDTVLNTTLSMGRKANTTVGQNSTALGINVEASGRASHAEGSGTQATAGQSHAEGSNTQATGNPSHAEGTGTLASGGNSHAEGGGTQATGGQSHAEGNGSQATGGQSHAEGADTQATGNTSHAEGGITLASGDTSHAEGQNTIANGTAMHAQGKYNKSDDTIWPDWVASKSYAVGDKVTKSGNGYICKTANSDATFTSRKWTQVYSNGDVAFVIGNGTAENARSNAFTVKWDGTTTAAGDIYANDSKKVATEEYVNTAVAGAGGGSDLTSIENRLAVLEGDEDTEGSVAEAKAVADQALEEAQSCVYVDQGPANSGHHLWVDGDGNVTAELPTCIMSMDSSRTKTFVITFGSNGELTVSEKEQGHSVVTQVYNYKSADDALEYRIKALEDKVAALEGT